MSKIPTIGLPSGIRSLDGLKTAQRAISVVGINITPVQRQVSTTRLSPILGTPPPRVPGTSPATFLGYRLFSTKHYPEHKKVALPALSPTMEMGTVVSWLKKEGDQLKEGDLLCEIETDKATMGFETPEEGYLAKIMIAEGTKDIPIGKLLCVIVENQNEIKEFIDYQPEEKEPLSQTATPITSTVNEPVTTSFIKTSTQAVEGNHSSKESVVPDLGRVAATPFAKKIAAEQGLDLKSIAGTGPGGRIIATDLANAIASTATVRTSLDARNNNTKDILLTNMRRTIAKRLTESKTTIPHYYLTSEIVLDQTLMVQEKLNVMLAKGAHGEATKLSINDFVIKASALACLRVPECNSFWMDTFIRQNNVVDVSVAVATPEGLITPIIFNAHTKGLATISTEVKELARKAKAGKLQPNEFQGGTFTISNLGMFGSVNDFTAIINPPQSCILAVGGAEARLVPCEKEGYKKVKIMRVTLSCDHRTVDGAIGAAWLKHFKGFLESPQTMLL